MSKNYLNAGIIYGLVGSLSSIMNIIILPFIEGENKLSATDFSQIAILESLTVLLYLIVFFSAGSVISRFYWNYNRTSHDLNDLVSSVISSILLRGVLLAGIILIISALPIRFFHQPELQHFERIGFSALIIGLTRSITNTIGSLYRNQKKLKSFIVFGIYTTLIRIAGQLAGLYFIEFSFMGFIYGSLISNAALLIYILFSAWYKHGFHFKQKILKEIRLFSYPLFMYELLIWVTSYADRFFLEKNPADMGIYDISLRFALGVRMIIQGFHAAIQPDIYRLLSYDEKPSNIQHMLNKISETQIKQTILVIMIFMLPAIYYLLNFCESDISRASAYIPIVFVFTILKSQYLLFSLPILFGKKTKLMLYTNLISLTLNLSINYFFIPRFGIFAALMAAFFSDIVIVFVFFYFGKTVIHFNKTRLILIPLIIVIIAIFIEVTGFFLPLNPYIKGIIITSILGLVYIFYYSDIQRLKISQKT